MLTSKVHLFWFIGFPSGVERLFDTISLGILSLKLQSAHSELLVTCTKPVATCQRHYLIL